MKKNNITALFLLVAILCCGGLLVFSISSAIWGFLEEPTLEVKAGTSAAVVLVLAAVTYRLLPKN